MRRRGGYCSLIFEPAPALRMHPAGCQLQMVHPAPLPALCRLWLHRPGLGAAAQGHLCFQHVPKQATPGECRPRALPCWPFALAGHLHLLVGWTVPQRPHMARSWSQHCQCHSLCTSALLPWQMEADLRRAVTGGCGTRCRLRLGTAVSLHANGAEMTNYTRGAADLARLLRAAAKYAEASAPLEQLASGSVT